MTHKTIQLLRGLKNKKERQASGLFVVEGRKMVSELIESQIEIEAIYCCEEEIISHPKAVLVKAKDMGRISAFSTPPGILAVAKQPIHTWPPQNAQTNWVLCDELSDPGNLGTILRTADWFGIGHIMLSEQSVDPFNPKVIQATMGAIFRQKIYRCPLRSGLEWFKQKQIPIIAADMQGKTLNELEVPKHFALVIGNESHGISQTTREAADILVHIPGKGQSESLNAGVAFGILCYSMSL